MDKRIPPALQGKLKSDLAALGKARLSIKELLDRDGWVKTLGEKNADHLMQAITHISEAECEIICLLY